MTSNHFTKCLNNLMWFILYTLPFIVFIGVSVKNGVITDFETVFTTLGFNLDSTNIIFTAFNDIFGSDGVFPLFLGTGVISFASYYASCYLVHFICDVLLWIVRWAHDFMNKGDNKELWK